MIRAGLLPALVWMLLVAGAAANESLMEPPPGTYPVRRTVHADFFPILLFTPDTEFGVGLGAWIFSRETFQGTYEKPDNLWISGTFTQQNQTIIQIIPEFFFQEDRYRLKIHLKYLDFPTKFYGIGNDTPERFAENYKPLTARGRVEFTLKVYQSLSLGLLTEFDRTEIVDFKFGGILDRSDIPGKGGSTLAGAGVMGFWDTRDHHFYPRMGSYHLLSVASFAGNVGSDYEFVRFDANLRWFFPAFKSHVLAVQAVAQSIFGTAPFNALPMMGGKSLFRGYLEGRYRDKNLLALQMEYRLPLSDRFGGVAFLSYGDVATHGDQFALSDFKAAAGLGVRYAYNRQERINVRFDVAATEESVGAYFSVGEAF